MKAFKKSKKGMLLAEETLKIVVSVIVMAILVYFLASLYFGKLKDDTMKRAEQALIKSDESIKNIIESLKEGSSKRIALEGISDFGDDWHLFGFTAIDEKKPNACAGKNCLCICDDVALGFFEQANECNKDGICEIAENLKNEKIDIEIEKNFETEIIISKENGEISIKEEI